MDDEATDNQPAQATLVDSYVTLTASYMIGIVRLLEAENATLKTQLAFSILRSKCEGASPPPPPYEEVVVLLRRITRQQFDAFGYVTELSYLVYATTLLDSFLSDTTKFLFLVHPRSMGKDLSIRLDSVIAAASREDLLNLAASKKTRELSFLPVLGRIDFLKATFGLRIELDKATIDALEHYSTLRNVIVHDQSVFDVILGQGGSLNLTQKTCAQHPTPLKSDELRQAENAHRAVVRAVFEAVVSQVLKGDASGVSAALGFQKNRDVPASDRVRSPEGEAAQETGIARDV